MPKRFERPVMIVAALTVLFSIGYYFWFNHQFPWVRKYRPQQTASVNASAPWSPSADFQARYEREHPATAMLESNGWLTIVAVNQLHNTAWINGDLWTQMTGQLKEDSAAALSDECAMIDKSETADIEIRDQQTAKLLATWKYSWGSPSFTAY